jgi:hypothetical protein
MLIKIPYSRATFILDDRNDKWTESSVLNHFKPRNVVEEGEFFSAVVED